MFISGISSPIGCSTNTVFFTSNGSFLSFTSWRLLVNLGMGMMLMIRVGGVARDIMLVCRRAKLKSNLDPSSSIPAVKIEATLAARTPDFHNFLQ